MKRAVMLLGLGVAVLSLVVATQFIVIQHHRAQAVAALEVQDQQQKAAIRKILCFADANIQTSKQRTDEEKRNASLFYNSALALIDQPPCKRADTHVP